MPTIDPADDPLTPGDDRYRPAHTDPYTVGEKILVGLAILPFLYCISCLSRTPFWMATHASRRRLLWWLVASEVFAAAVIVAIALLV